MRNMMTMTASSWRPRDESRCREIRHPMPVSNITTRNDVSATTVICASDVCVRAGGGGVGINKDLHVRFRQ